jgi:hypothetical protein
MTDKTDTPVVTETADDARRAFLTRAGKVAVVAPAAALLLAASTRMGHAVPPSGQPG